MSVHRWAYDPDKCDGNPCPGDCDCCPKAEDDVVDEEVDDERQAMAVQSEEH